MLGVVDDWKALVVVSGAHPHQACCALRISERLRQYAAGLKEATLFEHAVGHEGRTLAPVGVVDSGPCQSRAVIEELRRILCCWKGHSIE